MTQNRSGVNRPIRLDDAVGLTIKILVVLSDRNRVERCVKDRNAGQKIKNLYEFLLNLKVTTKYNRSSSWCFDDQTIFGLATTQIEKITNP